MLKTRKTRTVLAWLVSRLADAREVARKGSSREITPTLCSIYLRCCRILERLQLGESVRLRVDGALSAGVYLTGGAVEEASEYATVGIVPTKDMDRLLLASPFSEDATVLR